MPYEAEDADWFAEDYEPVWKDWSYATSETFQHPDMDVPCVKNTHGLWLLGGKGLKESAWCKRSHGEEPQFYADGSPVMVGA